MQSQIRTYYFRKFVNTIVDSTLTSPSLAELLHHHLTVDWARQSQPPYLAIYKVHDDRESYLEVSIVDARGYSDPVYERGLALMTIGVNGALVSLDDETFAAEVFNGRPFRICQHCLTPFVRWLDYYGHIKTNHWEEKAIS